MKTLDSVLAERDAALARVARLETALVEERAQNLAEDVWLDDTLAVARYHAELRERARAELVAEGLLGE